jgi:hypothetical protein
VLGFPIRTSPDQRLVGDSPRLNAASHVLHRLLMPRHPPCALKNLATKMLASTMQFTNNKQKPAHPAPRHPNRDHAQRRHHNPNRYDRRPAPSKKSEPPNLEPENPLTFIPPTRVNSSGRPSRSPSVRGGKQGHHPQAVAPKTARFLRTQQCAQPDPTTDTRIPTPTTRSEDPETGGTSRPNNQPSLNSQCSTNEHGHAPNVRR